MLWVRAGAEKATSWSKLEKLTRNRNLQEGDHQWVSHIPSSCHIIGARRKHPNLKDKHCPLLCLTVSLQHPLLTKSNVAPAGKGLYPLQRRLDLELKSHKLITGITWKALTYRWENYKYSNCKNGRICV